MDDVFVVDDDDDDDEGDVGDGEDDGDDDDDVVMPHDRACFCLSTPDRVRIFHIFECQPLPNTTLPPVRAAKLCRIAVVEDSWLFRVDWVEIGWGAAQAKQRSAAIRHARGGRRLAGLGLRVCFAQLVRDSSWRAVSYFRCVFCRAQELNHYISRRFRGALCLPRKMSEKTPAAACMSTGLLRVAAQSFSA